MVQDFKVSTRRALAHSLGFRHHHRTVLISQKVRPESPQVASQVGNVGGTKTCHGDDTFLSNSSTLEPSAAQVVTEQLPQFAQTVILVPSHPMQMHSLQIRTDNRTSRNSFLIHDRSLRGTVTARHLSRRCYVVLVLPTPLCFAFGVPTIITVPDTYHHLAQSATVEKLEARKCIVELWDSRTTRLTLPHTCFTTWFNDLIQR